MSSYVSLANGTQQGVGQHMKPGIRVRMTVEPAVMRDIDASKPKRPAGNQTMNIVALPCTCFHPNAGAKPKRGDREICWGCNLAIARIARNLNDLVSSPLHYGGIIRHVDQSGLGGLAVSLEQGIEAKSLRRLTRCQPLAIDNFPVVCAA